MMSPMVKLTYITKRYQTEMVNKIILNSISLEINEGETVLLLGKNGAGKSTLAGILTGMIKSDSGEVYFMSENIKSGIKYKNHIGYMGQTTTFFPFLKTKEILYLFSRLKGITKKEANTGIDKLMENFKTLKDNANTYFVDLSYGTKRLLSFCIATLNSPKLLILDEPTESLDTYNRRKLWEIISVLKRDKNITILVISHHPENELIEPTRIIMINEGNIIYDKNYSPIENETIQKIYKSYA